MNMADIPRVRFSLARKLLLALIGIFLVTYLSISLIVLGNVRIRLQDSARESLELLATEKQHAMQHDLLDEATNLRAWVRLDVMNDLVTDDVDGRIARALVEMRRQYRDVEDIYAFNARGKLIATSFSPPIADRGLPAVWKPRPGHDVTFLDKHANPYGKGDIVALSVPARASYRSEDVVGTLVIAFPWNRIEEMLHAPSATILVLGDGGKILYDDTGHLIGTTDIAALGGRPALLPLAGQNHVAGYSQSHAHEVTPRWQVIAFKSYDDAMAPIHDFTRLVLLWALGLGGPTGLLLYWLSRRFIRPIVTLTDTALAISHSTDLTRRVEVTTNDEVGVLREAFNYMIARLQQTFEERTRVADELERLNRTLEKRVRERTDRLVHANENLEETLARLKSAQSQLVHSEKMAALGQLVAGVAHELNNPISSIYANLPILETYIGRLTALIDACCACALSADDTGRIASAKDEMDYDFIREDIAKIITSARNGAGRVKEIVLSLRNFSRLDEAEIKEVRLEDGLDSTLALLAHQTRNRIRVEKNYRLNVAVGCHAGQMNQVFMNLLANAIQAIQDEGTITIDTEADGDYAVVRIADTGTGIPKQHLENIFDPFFTTKKIGEGTGLGLSISYGIVEKHHGRIAVSSTPGKGAVFTLYLPLRQPDAATHS